jgi:hypothetical protein
MTRSIDKRWFCITVWSSVLILSLFVLSSRREFGYLGPTVVCGFTHGCVALGLYIGPNPPGWFFERADFNPRINWWPLLVPNAALKAVALPLWILFVITAAVAVVSWRRLRARLPGHCRKCDYDLTGNESGVCPECGEKVQRR